MDYITRIQEICNKKYVFYPFVIIAMIWALQLDNPLLPYPIASKMIFVAAAMTAIYIRYKGGAGYYGPKVIFRNKKKKSA